MSIRAFTNAHKDRFASNHERPPVITANYASLATTRKFFESNYLAQPVHPALNTTPILTVMALAVEDQGGFRAERRPSKTWGAQNPARALSGWRVQVAISAYLSGVSRACASQTILVSRLARRPRRRREASSDSVRRNISRICCAAWSASISPGRSARAEFDGFGWGTRCQGWEWAC